MTLSQFDVLDNPIPRARRALPFVAILQSDLADTGRERVVAPLAPRAAMPTLGGRLIPIVEGQGRVRSARALTDRLAVMDLRHVVANLADDRERILAALGYLFIGF